MNEWMDGRNERVDEGLDERMWVNARLKNWMNDKTNEWKAEWLNEFLRRWERKPVFLLAEIISEGAGMRWLYYVSKQGRM